MKLCMVGNVVPPCAGMRWGERRLLGPEHMSELTVDKIDVIRERLKMA